MSEWYDNQKKPASNFRKLLQERLDKVNPRRKLSAEEEKRLSKLEAIAVKLKRGDNVQNRQLQTWLSVDEYEQIAAEWDTQKLFREELKDKPSELKRYEDKLKEAIMMRNRSDACHRKGKKSAAYKLDGKCESLCEDALEILQEIVAADASLQIWFDRHLDFGHGSLIDASLGNLPRLVTSRSIEKLSDDSRLVKKIDVKISVVECAIYSIGRDTTVSSKGDRLMLEKFLNTDD
ncbi:hypothetical protein Ping_2942 [Psychromonas ingrahamii 37]|uniref:Uncharacterized protein n=1 Tax=Psychromonas ingrahamii (strain DSM 17664 / CCUG 51855 / 37) TaxID=357804 RepID=A1SYS9_PSYIN|nr:hypothetical protein [Psychromonas ingrahamii]ABM04644.1 hypothetical protein Ping_2942 [Psychromonas ingrahamii 37]